MFSRGRNRQRLASANKLRVVLFTSSRKLDTKADKKERARVRARARCNSRMPWRRWQGGGGCRPKETLTRWLKDTHGHFYLFFCAPPVLPGPLAFIFCSAHSNDALRGRGSSWQFTYLDIVARADARAPAPSSHLFTTLCKYALLMDSRVSCKFLSV